MGDLAADRLRLVTEESNYPRSARPQLAVVRLYVFDTKTSQRLEDQTLRAYRPNTNPGGDLRHQRVDQSAPAATTPTRCDQLRTERESAGRPSPFSLIPGSLARAKPPGGRENAERDRQIEWGALTGLRPRRLRDDSRARANVGATTYRRPGSASLPLEDDRVAPRRLQLPDEHVAFASQAKTHRDRTRVPPAK